MGRKNTRLSPHGERTGGEYDEDKSVIEFMSYRGVPPASKGKLPPDDAVPLFLSDRDDFSDHDEPPRRPSFGRNRIDRDEEEDDEEGHSSNLLSEAISPKIIKVGIAAAAAATVIVGILLVGNPMALFENAKASLTGTAAGLSSAANQTAAIQTRPALEPVRVAEPVVAMRSSSADQLAPEVQSTFGNRALAPTQKNVPTRDEIASAFKTARQPQPEAAPPPAAAPAVVAPVVVAPVVVAPASVAPPVHVATADPASVSPAAPPVRRLDADELASLMKRAKGLIAIGDFVSARLLLKRAADAQEAGAALLLAQTYDPAVLGKQDMRSITPDPAKAREWYQKAAAYGSREAQQRLSQMQN